MVFCLVVCFGVNLFVTIFLCSVFVSRSFAAALPFSKAIMHIKYLIPEYLKRLCDAVDEGASPRSRSFPAVCARLSRTRCLLVPIFCAIEATSNEARRVIVGEELLCDPS